jgi:peptidoglycan/LPS O-acetylase OafA/YrhL
MYGHITYHLECFPPSIFGKVIHLFQGVPIFFVISGFLIYFSIEKTPNFKTFFSKRVLRLYPELWVCVLIELVSILVFYHEPIDWKQFTLFGFGQGTVFQYWTPDFLRGYGVSAPNGSLWTIPPIVEFYILIWLCYKFLNKQKMAVWIGVIVASLFFSISWELVADAYSENIFYKLVGVTVFPFLWIFLVGAFIARFYDKLIPFLSKYWWSFLLFLMFFSWSNLDVYASYGIGKTLSLAAFVIGFAYQFPKINIKTDISYAVYIYHMIFVNIAVELGWIKNWGVLVMVVIVTIIFALLSTKYVGGWSRLQKKRINN